MGFCVMLVFVIRRSSSALGAKSLLLTLEGTALFIKLLVKVCPRTSLGRW